MPRIAKPKATPTKSEILHQDMRAAIKGREGKQAVDEFVAAIHSLIDALGKQDAMSLFVKAGILTTLAKDGKQA